jgi:hypothetical protein
MGSCLYGTNSLPRAFGNRHQVNNDKSVLTKVRSTGNETCKQVGLLFVVPTSVYNTAIF